MNKKKGKRIQAIIRSEDQQWITKKTEAGEFYNMSHAIQRCILISKRIYEDGTNEEKAKFIHGRKQK